MDRVAPDSDRASAARTVLQVLAFVAAHPEGIRASDVADFSGKSLATSYRLLGTICQEGFARRMAGKGRYCPAEGIATPFSRYTRALPAGELYAAVEYLYHKSGHRTYLAVLDGGTILIHEVKGRQGQPRMLGVGRKVRGEAHALAIGKAILAHLPPRSVDSYARRTGLRAFTSHTIVDPIQLRDELETVRRTGVALDREEFTEGFCCLATPLLGPQRQALGALGISPPATQLASERPRCSGSWPRSRTP